MYICSYLIPSYYQNNSVQISLEFLRPNALLAELPIPSIWSAFLTRNIRCAKKNRYFHT